MDEIVNILKQNRTKKLIVEADFDFLGTIVRVKRVGTPTILEEGFGGTEPWVTFAAGLGIDKAVSVSRIVRITDAEKDEVLFDKEENIK